MLLSLLACAALSGCDFDTEVADALPGDETDCGYVADGADGTAAWTCAIDAWTAGQAFQVRWETWGIDSRILRAMISDGTSVWTLSQDQYGAEPWGVDGYGCVDPYESKAEAGYAILACTSTTPEGNHYAVCEDPSVSSGTEPEPWPM